jgi:hypothetical protein
MAQLDLYGSIHVFLYSLRPILLFANIDISRHILVIDTSVLAKSIMDRSEEQVSKSLLKVTSAEKFLSCSLLYSKVDEKVNVR